MGDKTETANRLLQTYEDTHHRADIFWGCLNKDEVVALLERITELGERAKELEARIAELEGEDNPWGADGEYGEW